MPSDTDSPDWSEKKIFTTGEAAKVCKVSQQTIIRCFDSGRLRGYRVPGSKTRRIPRGELIRFMRGHHMPLDVLGESDTVLLIVELKGDVALDEPDVVAVVETVEVAEEDAVVVAVDVREVVTDDVIVLVAVVLLQVRKLPSR